MRTSIYTIDLQAVDITLLDLITHKSPFLFPVHIDGKKSAAGMNNAPLFLGE